MCIHCKEGCCSQCEEWCDDCRCGPLCQDCIFIVVVSGFCYDCYIKESDVRS